MIRSSIAALVVCAAVGGVAPVTGAGLAPGDVCYRFCEDGSEPPVNRKGDCPAEAPCRSPLSEDGANSFDSCGDRAHVCHEAATTNATGLTDGAPRAAVACSWAGAVAVVSLALGAQG
mmetsp:Transcript_22333/g.64133  ORF Transcript_22333/g.64133 Transcript_22333/m.64133 type:complete len:118 (+) Transcript_22333:3-356(+)